MRRDGLLHPELVAVVTAMGHGETLCIGDAGLPVPAGTPIVQLGFRPGRPPFLDVVDAVLGELVVESAVVASELTDDELRDALVERLDPAPVTDVTHAELKDRLASCRAVVRTGEFTPFANVVLTAGVAF